MKDFEVVNGISVTTRNTRALEEGYKRPAQYRSDPEVIEELKALSEKNDGLLKPGQVVTAAESEDSPLHKLFEWDDTEAAERYRLIQARTIIAVSVEYIPIGKKVKPQKVFVSLSSDRTHKGGGYRTLLSVMSDKDKRRELIQDALEDMSHFEERYKNLKEVQTVIEVMQKTKNEIA